MIRKKLVIAIPIATLLFFTVIAQSQITDKPNLFLIGQQHPDSIFSLLKEKKYDTKLPKGSREEVEKWILLGEFLYHAGNYPKAMEHLLTASTLALQNNHTDLLARAVGSLGLLAYYNRQLDKAKEYFNDAIRLSIKINSHTEIARAYSLLGFYHEKNGQPDSAFHYQHTALHHSTLANNSLVLAGILESIGSIFEDLASYDSATCYYKGADSILLFHNEKIDRLRVQNNLGDMYRKTGNYEKALPIYHRVREMAEKLSQKYQLNSAYRDLGKTYKLMGNLDSAYYYLEKSKEISDEIYAQESNRQMAIQSVIFETEKKDAEIQQLRLTKRINSQLLIGSFICFVLLTLLLYSNYKRQKIKLKAEKEIKINNEIILQQKNELIEAELRNKKLEEDKLKEELALKGKELSSQLLHVIQKNELIETIRAGLSEVLKDDKRDQKKPIKGLLARINENYANDKYWEEFRSIFDQLHNSFFTTLLENAPVLTQNDLRLLSLIKMNLSNQEIATLLGISPDSLRVSKYRIKKKLNLQQDDSLSNFLQSLDK